MNDERFLPRQESEETKDTPIRDRFESVIDFLRISREKNDPSEEDDTEDGVTRRKKGKSSRWRKFMRGLFGGGGSQEAQDSSERPFRSPLIAFEPVPVSSRHEATQAVEQNVSSVSETLNEETQQLSTEARAGAPEDNQDVAESLPQEPNRAEVVDNPEAFEQQNLRNQQQAQEVNAEVEDQYAQEQVFHVNREAPEEAPEKDRKKNSATGTLLALDYLNYRGRKNLEKKVDKQQRENIKALKKSKQELEAQSQRLEQASGKHEAPKSQARAEKGVEVPLQGEIKINHEQQRPVTEKNQPEILVRNQEIVQDAQSKRQQEFVSNTVRHEAAPEKLEEQQNESPILDQLREKQAYERQIAKERLEQRRRYEEAEEAAKNYEKDSTQKKIEVPKELSKSSFTEREHERKHEVRDKRRDSQAASIGSVISQIQRTHNGTSHNVENNVINPVGAFTARQTQKTPIDQQNQTQDMYSHAIRNGFVTAVIAIAIGLTLFALA